MLLKPSHYRSAAKESLASAQHPGRVILVHTGAVLLLSLILTLLDHLLDRQIGNTAGLGGMDQRSVLVTIQSVLRLAQLILLPFWQIGYTYYTLRIARKESAGFSDLLQGFRRWSPVLRLKLLVAGIAFLLTMASVYAGAFLFSFTPWASSMTQEIELLIASGLVNEALAEALIQVAYRPGNLIPILICFGVFFLIGGAVLFFRFRLAELWLMDHPKSGARDSLRCSRVLMQGSWKSMFRLDLSFWWFYLLEVLITVLCYGDLMLGAMGVEMTNDAFGSYILFFVLYLCAQLALYWWKRNEVAVTYAHAYVQLCPKEKEKA